MNTKVNLPSKINTNVRCGCISSLNFQSDRHCDRPSHSMAKPPLRYTLYPIVYLDCIVVKVRHNNTVINKAVFLALGVNTEGQKDLLGLWKAENEGAKFWLSVLIELKNRGLQDILIACGDGLKGFPDAINIRYPNTHIQLCIIHMVRNNLKYVSWKDYKAVTSDLKKIYQSVSEDEALYVLDEFGQK